MKNKYTITNSAADPKMKSRRGPVSKIRGRIDYSGHRNFLDSINS